MTNIFDYLLWRGDISLSKEYGFNEVDSLILARFSYLPFDKIMINDRESIETISKKIVELDEKEFVHYDDKELAKYLMISSRYMELEVTDIIKNSDRNVEKQFGAVTIHLPNNELYISYMGTDNTINGWKEDFNMAFMDNVPCQLSGLDYLNNILKKYHDKKIRIGGHSKGGNIAIYSSLATSLDIQDRIIKIDNFDGPGFNKSITERYSNNNIINKIVTYIPQESIIGRLLNSVGKTIICESNVKGILEHEIYTWSIKRVEIVKLDKTKKISEDVNEAVTEWLKNTTKEQRKIFIDTIFEVLNGSEVDSFREIVSSITVTIPKILKKYKELTEEEKKIMTEMTKKFISSYFTAVIKKK